MGFVKKAALGQATAVGGTTTNQRRKDLVVIYRPKPIKPKRKKNNGIRQDTS